MYALCSVAIPIYCLLSKAAQVFIALPVPIKEDVNRFCQPRILSGLPFLKRTRFPSNHPPSAAYSVDSRMMPGRKSYFTVLVSVDIIN